MYQLAMGHSHAATHRDIPADDIGGIVRNGDVAEIVRKHVDIVRRRHRDHDLEFARQISLAIDRLDNLPLAARDPLAIEPDFPVGGGVRQQVVGYGARQLNRGGVRA